MKQMQTTFQALINTKSDQVKSLACMEYSEVLSDVHVDKQHKSLIDK